VQNYAPDSIYIACELSARSSRVTIQFFRNIRKAAPFMRARAQVGAFPHETWDDLLYQGKE
jgi:hypothetical protein